MPEPDLRTRRRGEILDAAREIVAREGLERLTISALERQVPFTRGVITYHFDNKDEIVAALLEEAVADIHGRATAAVQEASAPDDAVVAAIRAMVTGFLDHRDATQVLLSFWGRLERDAHARERNARLYRTYREQAARLVRRGQKLGRFRGDADVEAVSAVMVGAVIGIVAQVVFEPDAVDAEAAVVAAGRSLACSLSRAAPIL